jgi:hypothetical protein
LLLDSDFVPLVEIRQYRAHLFEERKLEASRQLR